MRDAVYPPGRLQFAILIAQRLFKKPCTESLAAKQIVHSASAGKEPELAKGTEQQLTLLHGPWQPGELTHLTGHRARQQLQDRK